MIIGHEAQRAQDPHHPRGKPPAPARAAAAAARQGLGRSVRCRCARARDRRFPPRRWFAGRPSSASTCSTTASTAARASPPTRTRASADWSASAIRRRTSAGRRATRSQFPAVYAEMKKMFAARRELTGRPEDAVSLVCTGPIKYVGHKEIEADIAHLKAAAAGRAGGRGVRHRDLAHQPRDVLREPVLQVRGGVPLRARRRDARGVQGDRRRRLRAPGRRSAAHHPLEPRPGSFFAAKPKVHRAAHRGVEPRARGHPARSACASTPATASTSRRACTTSR